MSDEKVSPDKSFNFIMFHKYGGRIVITWLRSYVVKNARAFDLT